MFYCKDFKRVLKEMCHWKERDSICPSARSDRPISQDKGPLVPAFHNSIFLSSSTLAHLLPTFTQHFSTVPQTLWIRKMMGWRGMSNCILAIEMYSHLCSSVSSILLTVVMMAFFTSQLGHLVPLLQPFAGVWDHVPYRMQLGNCHIYHPTKAWCPGRAPETLYTHATKSLQHTPKRAAPHFRK